MLDPLRVPKREWTWGDAHNGYGAHTFEGQLVWWARPYGPNGYLFESASIQSFDQFLDAGPPVEVPAEIVKEIQEVLRAAQEGGPA